MISLCMLMRRFREYALLVLKVKQFFYHPCIRKFCRFFCLLIICCFSDRLCAESAYKILLLNSYHEDYKWTHDIVSSFKDELSARQFSCEYFNEYMDTKRIVSSGYFRQYRDFLAVKYRDCTFDLIFVTDDNALHFLSQYYDDLFPGVPVVFCGINNLEQSLPTRKPEFTGILSSTDAYGTLSLIERLHPSVSMVVVVSDGTPTGIGQRKIVEQNEEMFPKFQFDYLNGSKYTTEELCDQLAKLPSTAAVLMTIWLRDKSGCYFDSHTSFEIISAASAVPVYGLHDLGLTHGIVGGKLTCARVEGATCAHIALDILKGGMAPHQIPIQHSIHNYIFDFNQLQRWNIPLSALPVQSIIINRSLSYFEQNKTVILSGASFLIFLCLIITALVINIIKRRAMEATLLRSEKNFRMVLENSRDIIYSFNLLTGKLNYLSPSVKDIVEYSAEKIKKLAVQEWLQFVHRDDVESVKAYWRDFLSQERDAAVQCLRFRVRTHTNKIRWLSDNHSVLTDAMDRPLFIVGTMRDITIGKENEEIIRKSELRLRTILNTANEGFLEVTVDGVVTGVNPKLCQILGYAEEKLQGKMAAQLVPYNEVQSLHAMLIDNNNSGNVKNEITFLQANGSPVYCLVKATPILDKHGFQTGAFALISDITERKIAENRLRESEEKFRLVFENSGGAFFISDLETGLIVECNKQAELLLGMPRSEIIAMELSQIHPHDEREYYAQMLRCHLETPRAREFETVIKNSAGAKIPVIVSAQLLDIENRKLAVSFFIDIRERIIARNQLINQAEELKRSNIELEQFAFVASHDLQEPLRIISGYLDLLYKTHVDALSEEGKHFVKRSIANANTMRLLINDLLMISRIGKTPLKTVKTDMNALFEDVIANLQNAIKQNNAHVTCEPLPDINADPTLIRQVLHNLIENAIKFKNSAPIKIHVSSEKHNGAIIFLIKDNGVGIDTRYKERIFKMFERLHATDRIDGTGIGLALCKKIIMHHGGRIWVESELGKGSTFYFSIPTK